MVNQLFLWEKWLTLWAFSERLRALRPLRPKRVALAPPAALQPGVGRAPERGRGPWQAPGGGGKSWENRWKSWEIPWKTKEIPWTSMEKLANIQEIQKTKDVSRQKKWKKKLENPRNKCIQI